MPGAGLTGGDDGKALSEKLALEPYWGKPAVRNFRGDDGDVGIIRSPVRAIVLPDEISSGRSIAGRGAHLPTTNRSHLDSGDIIRSFYRRARRPSTDDK